MSIIRSMTAEDAAKVASLEAEIFSQPWSENAFLDSLCLPDTIFLVAEESGGVPFLRFLRRFGRRSARYFTHFQWYYCFIC